MKVFYNGCKFDSTLELKFALSIEDDCAYVIQPRRIFDSIYKLNGTSVEIEAHTKSYKPDFLVRSFSRNVASFIEIKPEGFNDFTQFNKRNRIIEQFNATLEIKIELNWVFGNNIELPKGKDKKLKTILDNQAKEKLFYLSLNRLYPHRNKKVPYTIVREFSTVEYLDFIYHGVYPNEV